MRFEKGNQYGRKFSSENQPEKNGRKPKLYNLAKEGYGLGLPEFCEIVQWLMQMPKEELRKISEDRETPIWMVTVCRALYKGAGDGKMGTLNELAERLWGKAGQKVDITSGGQPFEVKVVQAREELAPKIEKMLKGEE